MRTGRRIRIAAAVLGLVLVSVVLSGCCCCYCTGGRRYRPFTWPRLSLPVFLAEP